MTTSLFTKSAEGVETYVVEGESAEAVSEYLRLAALKREIEAAEKKAREAVDALFPMVEDGGKQIVQVGGINVLSRTAHYRDNVSVAALREAYPEAYAALNHPTRVTAWRKA